MTPGAAGEVFAAFLKLGLTSFGGPVAHLGYFRAEFVERRRWLCDADYADLVALCQFLPGPASSQVGIAIGLGRAGWPGALAAWTAFTLPSAVALVLFAIGVANWPALAQSGAVHGLMLASVAVVAQAVLGMVRSLCPDVPRGGLAIVAAASALALPSLAGQLAAMGVGAAAGLALLRTSRAGGLSAPPTAPEPPPTPQFAPGAAVSRRVGALLLSVLALLLAALPLLAAATGSATLSAVSAFYRAGALVFGGGHVVLPLLHASVVPNGWISDAGFLAGYGAAQAMPGPLFAVAAYLGAAMSVPPGGWTGALLMLAAIFLPAFLLVAGALPFWDRVRSAPRVRRAMAGVNAAVVGVLAAALVDPVWTGAVHDRADAALVLSASALLVFLRVPPLAVVLLMAAIGALR